MTRQTTLGRRPQHSHQSQMVLACLGGSLRHTSRALHIFVDCVLFFWTFQFCLKLSLKTVISCCRHTNWGQVHLVCFNYQWDMSRNYRSVFVATLEKKSFSVSHYNKKLFSFFCYILHIIPGHFSHYCDIQYFLFIIRYQFMLFLGETFLIITTYHFITAA